MSVQMEHSPSLFLYCNLKYKNKSDKRYLPIIDTVPYGPKNMIPRVA